jgi:hypothetical protein
MPGTDLNSCAGENIREVALILRAFRNTIPSHLHAEELPPYERESRPTKPGRYNQYFFRRIKARVEPIPADDLKALGVLLTNRQPSL